MKIFGFDSSDALSSLKGVYSSKIISSIKEKKFSIPESVIKQKLSKELDSDKLKLSSLNCKNDGLTVEIDAEKLGAKIHYAAFLKLSELRINPTKHYIKIDVQGEHLEGSNLRGKILSVLVKIIVDDIVAKAISMSSNRSNVSYDETSRRATVDLICIDAVAKLYKPLLFNKAPIDLVEVNGISHAKGSVVIHCDHRFH